LNSQVEALTQENKEKENELIDMELINLKNVSMFNFEEIRRTIQVEIEKLMEKNKKHYRNLQQLQAQLEIANERKKSLYSIYVKKILKGYDNMLHYYTFM